MWKFIFALLISVQSVWACRSAAFEDESQRYVVKSFDFDVPGGEFFANAKGVSKSALLLNPLRESLSWKSQLASVTFSQIGPGFPFGGMNEAGLTVESLWLPETQEGNNTTNPGVNESQFVQYILDMATDLNQVETLAKQVSVVKAFAPIHYFVCDKNRDCAVIELLKDGMNFKRLSNKDEQVIENIPVAKMLGEKTSNSIFASFLNYKKQNKVSVENAFAWLDKVKTVGWSRWQIVYDVKNLVVHFRELNDKGEVDFKGDIPVLGASSAFISRNGPSKWNEDSFEKNMDRFSAAFPQFKLLAPILKHYLRSTF